MLRITIMASLVAWLENNNTQLVLFSGIKNTILIKLSYSQTTAKSHPREVLEDFHGSQYLPDLFELRARILNLKTKQRCNFQKANRRGFRKDLE